MKVLSWTFTKYSSKFHAWITRLSQTLLTRLASCAVLPLQAFTSSPRWLSSFSHMTDCGFLPSGLLQDSHWPLLKCIKANLCLEYNEPSQTTILSPTPTPCSKPFSKILLHVLPHGHGELLIDFFFYSTTHDLFSPCCWRNMQMHFTDQICHFQQRSPHFHVAFHSGLSQERKRDCLGNFRAKVEEMSPGKNQRCGNL